MAAVRGGPVRRDGGQAVLATTTQVYVLFFLQRVLHVPPNDSYHIVAGALLLVMPLFPALGALSDRHWTEAIDGDRQYTSISLPYNLGNGWVGGFLPLIATALVAGTGNAFAWLAYPVTVALITAVVGWRYLRESARGSRSHLGDDRL